MLTKSDSNVSSETDRKQILLFDHQIAALEAKARTVALIGGTGAGKTWLAPVWLYRKAEANPGARFMAIGMQYERHILNVMQKQLLDFFDSIGARYKLVTGKRITLANGSEILFGSAEKPESLEGPHLTGGIWMDEAGYMTRMAYDVALRRTGYHQAPVFITTIPYIPGWLKTEVYKVWLAEQAAMARGEVIEPTVAWIPCRSIDNPHYNLDEVERAKRTMRPEKFATIYLGQFSKPFGLIYPEPEDDELAFDLATDFPNGIPESWPCFAGHDWGWKDPTTGIWGRYDRERDILYIVAEYERDGLTVEEHVYNWKALGLDYVDEAWGDSANPEQWETASRHAGFPISSVKKGAGSIAYGINVVYERMVTGRLRIERRLRTLFDYRARYVWDSDPRDDEKLLDRPREPQEAEHLMDALRYLCMGLVDSGLAPAVPALIVGRKTW